MLKRITARRSLETKKVPWNARNEKKINEFFFIFLAYSTGAAQPRVRTYEVSNFVDSFTWRFSSMFSEATSKEKINLP